MSMRHFGGCFLLLAFLAMSGCNFPHNRQLEQENNELRFSMKEKQELLERADARAAKQKETITACQEKIVSLEKKADAAELKSAELQKQLDLSRTKQARQEAELNKQTDYVKNFQKEISELKEQLEKMSGRPTTTTSAPAR